MKVSENIFFDIRIPEKFPETESGKAMDARVLLAKIFHMPLFFPGKNVSQPTKDAESFFDVLEKTGETHDEARRFSKGLALSDEFKLSDAEMSVKLHRGVLRELGERLFATAGSDAGRDERILFILTTLENSVAAMRDAGEKEIFASDVRLVADAVAAGCAPFLFDRGNDFSPPSFLRLPAVDDFLDVLFRAEPLGTLVPSVSGVFFRSLVVEGAFTGVGNLSKKTEHLRNGAFSTVSTSATDERNTNALVSLGESASAVRRAAGILSSEKRTGVGRFLRLLSGTRGNAIFQSEKEILKDVPLEGTIPALSGKTRGSSLLDYVSTLYENGLADKEAESAAQAVFDSLTGWFDISSGTGSRTRLTRFPKGNGPEIETASVLSDSEFFSNLRQSASASPLWAGYRDAFLVDATCPWSLMRAFPRER